MSARRTVRLVSAVAALTLLASLAPQSASAYWSVASSAASAGRASAATVNQGPTPTATVANRNQVTLSWAAGTLSNGVAVNGYTVTRYNTSNVAQSTLAGCTGTITATTCTETGLPDGLWTYTITPQLQNWIGAPSAASTQVRTDSTAPVNNINLSGASPSARVVKNGDTIFVRTNGVNGSFKLSNAVTDAAGSGPASSNTGGLGGTTTGWSHTPSSVSSPSGGPFVSNVFSWTSNASGEPVVGVAGIDNYGNTGSTTIFIDPDNAGPTGGAISYVNGLDASTTQTVSLAAIADSESGVGAGSRFLQRSTATLTGNTCGTFGSYSNHVTNPATLPATQTVNTPTGFCYRYRYVFTDSVSNQTVMASTSVIKVRAYQSTVANTAGNRSYWRMSDSNATIADSGPDANNGIYVNGPILGQQGAISADSNSSVFFDGSNDYGRVTRQIQDDFSIEFWFKSDQGLGNTNQWYSGAGLVDAEVPAIVDDFGTSLMADGRVGAGTGRPDVSIWSGPGYNDNQWHYVVFTRTRATGTLVLYLDGVQVASSAAAGTQSLTTPANIDFGHIQSASSAGTNHYRGNLDEIAIYNTALSQATITDHYQVSQLN